MEVLTRIRESCVRARRATYRFFAAGRRRRGGTPVSATKAASWRSGSRSGSCIGPELVLGGELDRLPEVRQRLFRVPDSRMDHGQQVLDVVVARVVVLELAELGQRFVERAAIHDDRRRVQPVIERPRLRLVRGLPLADGEVHPGAFLQLLLVREAVDDEAQKFSRLAVLPLLERLEPALERLDGLLVG